MADVVQWNRLSLIKRGGEAAMVRCEAAILGCESAMVIIGILSALLRILPSPLRRIAASFFALSR